MHNIELKKNRLKLQRENKKNKLSFYYIIASDILILNCIYNCLLSQAILLN